LKDIYMTWIFSNDDLDSVLSMRDCISALERGYRDLAEGIGGNRGRAEIVSPAGREGTVYALKSMDGVHTPSGFASIRLNSDIIGWREVNGSTRREKIPAAPHDRYVGLVLLFSTENGEPLAIFPDGLVQRMRVGATNGLAARYLAREDAATAAVIGTGWQAGAQAMAICAERPITRLQCYSPNKQNREAFALEMRQRLGIEVNACASVEEALQGADVVACATSALDPILGHKHIRAGVHYSSIKPAEIAPQAIQACDQAVVHLRYNAPQIVRTHGVELAEDKKGALAPSATIDEGSMAELTDLLTGKAEGRQTAQESTCFLNYSGIGYQFTLVGGLAYQKAREAGLGRELPTDWFTQVEHP
jgi:ornithine cyclodeaminase/alanine dehydrogenase-like protein (mu-crystallin family)